jgi:hypothetical protein
MDTIDAFVRFAASLDQDNKRESPKASWVHTYAFFLQRPRHLLQILRQTKEQRNSDAIFTSLLPRFTALRELSCRMYLTVDEFDVLTRTCGRTLTKLGVNFLSSSLPKAILLMERLVVLEDLYINILQDDVISYVGAPLVLPELRVLAVDYLHRLQGCFMQSYFPKLTSFTYRPRPFDAASLAAFLNVHGKNLAELRCQGVPKGFAALVSPFTPRLAHVDLIDSNDFSDVLAGLPQSVSTLTYSRSGDWFILGPIEQQSQLKDLLKAVEDLPRPNMLRTVRMRQAGQYFGHLPLSWQQIHAQDPEMLKPLSQRAARLLPLGIFIVDDEDAVLTDLVPYDGE